MPLFGGKGLASEAARVLGKSEESAQRKSFSRDFNVGNFDSFGGDVTAAKMTEIARFRIPSDTEYSWGYGAAENPDNQGFLYVDLQNASAAAVEGTIRFKVESSTGRRSEVVADMDTTKLDASKTDRTQQVPLPEQVGSSLASEDAYLVIEMEPNATDSIDPASSEVIVPVTEYDLS